MEPITSSWAATRMSEQSLADLNESIEEMQAGLDDQDVFFRSNRRFHNVIAWSSGNALFGYVVDALLGIMDGGVIGIDYSNNRRETILEAHREIYDAIAGQDAAGAL